MEAYREAQKKLKAAEDKMKKMQADAKAKPMDKELAAAAKTLATEFEAAKKAMPKEPLAAPVLSGNGQAMKVYIRGNPATKGEDAPKGFLQVIATNPEPKKDFTRLDLANAIATEKNPLTARVIVNRVWAWHFGRGIVATPSNFGKLGDAPSHPELLDWLAVEFVKHGWSIKWLHRQIMNAKVYQLAATGDAKSSDAANVYLCAERGSVWTSNRGAIRSSPSPATWTRRWAAPRSTSRTRTRSAAPFMPR